VPPADALPPQPTAQSGIEDAVAALKAALERDPEGFSTDATAKAILDKLNSEIAKMYGENDDDEDSNDGQEDGYDEEDGFEDGEDDETGGEDGEDDSAGAGGEDGDSSRVQLPKGPRPYDLWRAAHEIDRPAKPVRGLASPSLARTTTL